ncbi:hypothetical protein, partial [Pseudomonas sp. 30_B]|uniref:hypothetical protein n=1 Tax=Pseudomonas sp. 30_B TaxID=2813575 RepID=UPI001AA00961
MLFSHGCLPVLLGYSSGGGVLPPKKPGRLGFFAPFGGRRRAPALKRANRHKNAKGAWRPLVCPANRARQMRIGITTYLNSSFSGTVMR